MFVPAGERKEEEEDAEKGPEAKPKKPTRRAAREYPFTLDTFQQKSIECLERNESVMVGTCAVDYPWSLGIVPRR